VDRTEVQHHSILDELNPIYCQIWPCFLKIYSEVEAAFLKHPGKSLGSFEGETRSRIQAPEGDIRGSVVRLVESSTLNWSSAQLELEWKTKYPQNPLIGQEEHETKPLDNLWTHITISRDQTWTSEYRKVKLLVLRPQRYKADLDQPQLAPSEQIVEISTPYHFPLRLPGHNFDQNGGVTHRIVDHWIPASCLP
jgi:hypothetical protein